MLTPAQRHMQMHEAMEASEASRDAPLSGEDRILHRLWQDEKRLKGIQGKQRKAELKREILPEYQGWIDGVLAADTGRQDRVIVMCATWMIDTGAVEQAMPLIDYILRHNLQLPDSWGRTAAAFFVEEICNPALLAIKVDVSARPQPVALLLELESLTAGHDMPDQVRSKLCKLLGLTLRHGDTDSQQQALDYLIRAMQLHDGAGVKKEIDTLRRAISKAEPEQAPEPDGPLQPEQAEPPEAPGKRKKR